MSTHIYLFNIAKHAASDEPKTHTHSDSLGCWKRAFFACFAFAHERSTRHRCLARQPRDKIIIHPVCVRATVKCVHAYTRCSQNQKLIQRSTTTTTTTTRSRHTRFVIINAHACVSSVSVCLYAYVVYIAYTLSLAKWTLFAWTLVQ